MKAGRRHPDWLRVRAPRGPEVAETRRILRSLGLHSVCEEARCPNLGECWNARTATFLLLGEICTRRCRFCAVRHGRPEPPDPVEPERVAEAVMRLGLSHVVVTSVTRDDLSDGGGGCFAATAEEIRRRSPSCRIEVLTPDFQGDSESIRTVLRAPVDVFNHNVETVPRLYDSVRPGADYRRSLKVLRRAKEISSCVVTKSGLMLGLGEDRDEILAVLRDLRDAGCDIVTLGQYLQPERGCLPVRRYLPPEEFDELARLAIELGFRHVASGPLVRSSYHAAEQSV